MKKKIIQKNALTGHQFLSSIGKTVLRPGGITTTGYLIQWIKDNFEDTSKLNILEISCNAGKTLIDLYNNLKCNLTGIDIDEKVISLAKENIKKHNLDTKINVMVMDANKLEFPNNIKFDLIIAEAFLTMFENKSIFLSEFKKYLSPNGYFLNHDICYKKEEYSISEKGKTINNKDVLTLNEWYEILKLNGLDPVYSKKGPFSLLSPRGLIKDEGLFRAIKIIINANKKENKDYFKKFKNVYMKNKKSMCSVFISSKNN